LIGRVHGIAQNARPFGPAAKQERDAAALVN
jgi:hypothetical protein